MCTDYKLLYFLGKSWLFNYGSNLYPTHSRVGRVILVLRHSFLHIPLNFGGIACWVATFSRALPSNHSEKKLNILFPRVAIEPSTCHVYSYTLCPCATTGLNIFMLQNYFYKIKMHNCWRNNVLINERRVHERKTMSNCHVPRAGSVSESAIQAIKRHDWPKITLETFPLISYFFYS